MNNPHYILLPVSPLFIAFSLIGAFLLNLFLGGIGSAFPILLRWYWCFGASTSRAGSASASRFSWGC